MGLTMPEFESLIANDLNVTIATEVTAATVDRAVQRAVADFSRFFPLEQIEEKTLSWTVTDESVTMPPAASTGYIVNAVTLVGEAAGSTLTLSQYYFSTPTPVIVTIVDANSSISQLTLIVKGVDWNGHYQEESFYRHNGLVQYGKMYFSHITQVELDAVTGHGAGDTISVGNYDPALSGKEIWKKLTNKPIKPESETVTNAAGTTTYTRGTDYEMDYINGRIRLKNGGSMAEATTYLVDYTISRIGIDISDLPKSLIRISRVEYPVDQVPQQFPSFSFYGDLMYIGPLISGSSQAQMNEDEHIAIYFDSAHAPPSAHSPGSYPEVLDEVIAIGGAGYVLLSEAQQHEQQAATDLAMIRTTLDYLGIGGGTGTNTLLYKDIDDALGKVITYLETNGTTDNAKDRLAEITDMEAYLRDMIVKLSDGTGALATANTHLDEVDTTDLSQATVGAEGLLETGDGLIDAVNVGARVAENYADYARARAEIASVRINTAMGFMQEANTRLSLLRSYIEESAGWTAIGQTFIAEAQARISEAGVYFTEVQQLAETVNGDLVLADRFRAEGLSRLNEFHNILRNRAESRRRTSSVPGRQPA